jgi:hypothetical protein
VNDYSKLAQRLRCSVPAQGKTGRNLERQEFDPGAFFEQVKVQIIKELGNANLELYKQGLAPIERVLVPCYLGKLCLTYGTNLLCCVDFDGGRGQINSVIMGPPNRVELSRKEYRLSPAPNGTKADHESSTPACDGDFAAQGPSAVANEIVSGIIETGIRLMQGETRRAEPSLAAQDGHFAEFWISLASLLRSYTALHGLSRNHQAEIGAYGHTITVRQAGKWLILKRNHAIVTWTRENGTGGTLELTDHGRLRGPDGEEEMDLAAEAWARELMKDHATDTTPELTR